MKSIFLVAVLMKILVVGSVFAAEPDGPAINSPEPGTLPTTQAPPAEGAPKATTLTEVEVAWENNPGAKSYELEFQPIEGSEKAQRFTTEQTQYRASLLPGSYRFRIRSIDRRGDEGSWSRPVTIVAKAQEVSLQYPEANEQIEATEVRSKITFRWDPFADAKGYIFRIWSEGSTAPTEFRLRNTQTDVTLRAGKKYLWEVIPVSRSGVRYSRKTPPREFVLFGQQLPKPELVILRPNDPQGAEWRPAKNAYYLGKLFRRDLLDDEWSEVAQVENLELGQWIFSQKLSPGVYRVTIQGKANMRIASKVAEKEFLVKPKLEELGDLASH